MLFNSLEFLVLFLPAVLAIASQLRGRALLVFICAASATFYAFAGHVWFLAPMFATSTLDWWIGMRIDAAPSRAAKRVYLATSLVANLGLLAVFKYSVLILGTTWVVLPAGISFYTFQTISYVVDVYRGHGRAQHDYFHYLGFVTFFPHLVAGPLTRHDVLIPQLERIATDGIAQHRRVDGLYLFAIGMIKKVLIADRIAMFVDPMIASAGELGACQAWLALIGYALQIYFDFSGYSDMAVGLGRLFGVELPQNFDSPYKSKSPSEFWRRWHISLSAWLRDYLYISLGGNRRGSARTKLNLMLTMMLGGLWHGASWNFAAWGIYHGALLVLIPRDSVWWAALPARFRVVLTFGLVTLGWVPFRAPNLTTTLDWYAALGGRQGAGWLIGGALPGLVIIGLSIAWFAPNSVQVDTRQLSPSRAAALGLVFAAAVIAMTASSKFLYFQF